jgi:hypothetical protein
MERIKEVSLQQADAMFALFRSQECSRLLEGLLRDGPVLLTLITGAFFLTEFIDSLLLLLGLLAILGALICRMIYHLLSRG